jgi:endonuclease/exonuclease/phosphatase family metal-dependent hydrolase
MGRTQLKTFVDPILDALNYQTADRIVLAGDFNELYRRGLSNLQSLDFKGPSNPVTLRLPDNIGLNGANWNNWRTCCRPHNIDRQFDLFYSNFPNADAKVKAIGINDMSDHNPIRMRINDGPDY